MPPTRKRNNQVANDEDEAIVVRSTHEQEALVNGNEHSFERQNGTVQPRPKKQKSNKNNFADIEDEINYRDSFEMEAGIIEKIRLDNFMCHKCLEVEFCNNVNIITGESGSGKSAIITGLQVVLRAKVFTNNRMQDLIKTGEEYAVVTVTLRNRGKDAFHPEEYGNSITIERRIDRNGIGGFTIKNENGKMIGNKKEVVQQILNQFNIHIDNPTTVMTQDESRNFLTESSATDIYAFFLKATQLQSMLEGIEQTTGLNNSFQEIWKQKNESLEGFREELEKKRKEYEKAKYMEVIESSIEKLKHELLWSNFILLENELKTKKEALQIELNKLAKIESRLNESGTLDEAYRSKTFLTAKISSVEESIRIASNQILEKQMRVNEINRRAGAVLQQQSGYKRSITDAERTIERYRKEISDLNKRERVDKSAEEIKRDEQLKELKEQRVPLTERAEQLKTKIQELENEYEDKRRALGDKEEELERVARERNMTEKELENLIATSGSQLKMLDRNMPRLLEMVEKNRNRYESVPIGPVGHLIQPKDMKWALAIENCVFFAKRWFILHSKRDSGTFKEMAKTCGVAVGTSEFHGVGIIIQRHTTVTYNLQKPVSKFAVLADQVVVDPKKLSTYPIKYYDQKLVETTIVNALVDQLSMEKVILAENLDVASSVMFPNPIPEAKECYTTDGTKLFKRGNSEVTIRPKTFKTTLFIADLSGQMEDARRRIRETSQRLGQCEGEVRGLRTECEQARNILEKYQQERKIAKSQLLNLNMRITEIENRPVKQIVDDTEDLIHLLQQKISETEDYIENAKKKIEELEIVSSILNRMYNEDKKQIENMEEEIKKGKDDICIFTVELSDAMTQISAAVEEKDVLLAEIASRNIAELERKISEKAKELEEATSTMQYAHPERINTSRGTKEIEREIAYKQAELDKAVKDFRGRQFTDIKHEFITYEQLHMSKEKALQASKNNLDLIQNSRKDRMKTYFSIKNEFQVSVALLSNDYLSIKGHTGSIRFNDQQHPPTLNITVQLDSNKLEQGKTVTDLKSLSGGEKSFVLFSFLLSLWELVKTPFRVLDGFDISMDSVYSKISMDLLIDTAKVIHKTKQLIISTSQDVSSIKQDKLLKVITLGENTRVVPKSTSSKPAVGDYVVEYSKSNRSKCGITKQNISEGALRIGLYIQSKTFDGGYPIWFDFNAFSKNKAKVGQFAKAGTKVHGLTKLRLDDQDRVQKLMGISSTPAASVTSSSTNSSGEKTEEQKKYEEYVEENKKLWALKDKLNQLDKSDLVDMLTLNDQRTNGGKDVLVDRCAFGMLFGKLPRCPKSDCTENYLEFHDGSYRCTGRNEWSKCTFRAKVPEIQTEEWEVYTDTGYDFLDKYEFVKHIKCDYVAEKKINSEVLQKREEEEQKKKESDTNPFGALLIASAGKLQWTQKEIKETITTHGGEYANEVSSTVDFLITSENEVKKMTGKVETAKNLGIPIVKEEYITKSVEMKRKLLPKEMDDLQLYLFKPSAEELEKKRKLTQENTEEETSTNNTTTDQPVKKKQKVQIKVKGHSAVDPDFTDYLDYHVYEASPTNIYSVNLSMTDVSRNINSYYIFQVVVHDTKNTVFLFRKYGRVGTDIGNKLETEYDSIDDACFDFEKMYLDKTGNHWNERHHFQKKPGKYYPLEVDYSNANLEEIIKKQESASKNYKGTLAAPVRDLVSLLFDIKEMQRTLLSLEIDTEKMPLGKLSSKSINEGYSVLKSIQSALDRKKTDAHYSASDFKDDLLKLSNKFYTFIPQTFKDHIKIIDSEITIKEKLEMLDALQQMEIATTMLFTETSEEDPIDQHYKKLNIDIVSIPKEDEQFKMVSKYIQQTHAKTHRSYDLELVELFAVNKQEHLERFEAYQKLHNHQLLWHGSRLSNWVGILSKGLLIAPPSAPVTGYMFGKGIYFANAVSKSANYCFTSPQNNTGIMLLSEVALGNPYERLHADYIDKLPDGYHSCWGKGKSTPDPKESITLQDKTIVPLGKLVDAKLPSHASLLYDEFIVYDVAQVRMKYLLRVNFKYKTQSSW